MFFERIVAVMQYRSNAGFLIYIADSIGYLGSIVALLMKNFFSQDISAYRFLVHFGLIVGLLPLVLIIISGIGLKHKLKSLSFQR
jgi:hypothetical protein